MTPIVQFMVFPSGELIWIASPLSTVLSFDGEFSGSEEFDDREDEDIEERARASAGATQCCGGDGQ